MHIVENVLSSAEKTVVKTQIDDRIKRKFAESKQIASVTVTFEPRTGVLRRLLATGTSILTIIVVDNARNGIQPVYTTDVVDDALTSILTAIQMKVISSTTSVKLQAPQANVASADDGVLVGAIVVGSMTLVIICILACVLFKNYGDKIEE